MKLLWNDGFIAKFDRVHKNLLNKLNFSQAKLNVNWIVETGNNSDAHFFDKLYSEELSIKFF